MKNYPTCKELLLPIKIVYDLTYISKHIGDTHCKHLIELLPVSREYHNDCFHVEITKVSQNITIFRYKNTLSRTMEAVFIILRMQINP